MCIISRDLFFVDTQRRQVVKPQRKWCWTNTSPRSSPPLSHWGCRGWGSWSERSGVPRIGFAKDRIHQSNPKPRMLIGFYSSLWNLDAVVTSSCNCELLPTWPWFVELASPVVRWSQDLLLVEATCWGATFWCPGSGSDSIDLFLLALALNPLIIPRQDRFWTCGHRRLTECIYKMKREAKLQHKSASFHAHRIDASFAYAWQSYVRTSALSSRLPFGFEPIETNKNQLKNNNKIK